MATTAAAPAEAPTDDAPPPAKGKKKLILIVAAALLVLLLAGGGGAAYFVMKKKAAETAEADTEATPEGEPAKKAKKKKKDDKKHAAAPVFLPLDMFTVNLADREAERYAQVGVTLEVDDTKTSDHLKAYMPAIRNDILMVLAHKKAAQLQEREGKLELAREIKRAALKALRASEGDHEAGEDDGEDDEDAVRAVHFSNFIIQ